jgi:hypothetical protein
VAQRERSVEEATAGGWALTAHATGPGGGLVLEPARWRRAWMEATPNHFAQRCLPLTVANQAGWVVRCPFEVRARWNGAVELGNIELQLSDSAHPGANLVSDHFGSGIVTFSIPWLFRTPPGVSLLVRGAPNFWIEGAHALEGLVETDWATATFTMNWKLLTPGRWVTFRAGDPVCFIQPIEPGLIEAAEPAITDLAGEPELDGAYRAWASSRDAFNSNLARAPTAWQKDYFVGRHVDGEPAFEHRKRLRLAEFEGGEDPLHADPAPAAAAPADEAPEPPAPAPAAPARRAAPAPSGLVGQWYVVDDFSEEAHGLRAAAEDHFVNADGLTSERGPWDVFHVQDQYAYLRTPADRIVPPGSLGRLERAVAEWGWRSLGMGRMTRVQLSLYLAGCGQGLHNDAAGYPYAFIYSLSPASGFTGGETLLLRTEPYWGTARAGHGGGGPDFVHKIAPLFNRLLVIDTRVVHGVEPVRGSWDPGAGVVPLDERPVPADLTARIAEAIAATRFPPGPGTATFSVPIDDLGNETPCFITVAEVELEEVADGFVARDPDGRPHFLNPSAAYILLACTGVAEPAVIARQVQADFELPAPPSDLVERCLADLLAAGLIVEPTPVVP